MAKSRTNVIPIIEDARHPLKYRMLVGMVDCVFADVAQPDQGRIVALNSNYFLKNGGHFVISIKVRSTREAVLPRRDSELKTLIRAGRPRASTPPRPQRPCSRARSPSCSRRTSSRRSS